MIFIVIPTTPERRSRCNELVKSIQENTKDIKFSTIIYENNDGGWVPAVYNVLDGLTEDTLVWLLGSDTIVENNALKILYDTWIQNNPSVVIEPFNELHGPSLCQHPFGQVRMIKKYLDRGFVHWYSDNWFTIQAKRDLNLLYQPKAIISHNHFMNGKAPKDKTYETIFNPEQIAKDKQLFDKLNS